MTEDIGLLKQLHPNRLTTFINYVSIYTLCTACEIKRMLETLSFQKLSFPIDFY